jgi:hypothetical protein
LPYRSRQKNKVRGANEQTSPRVDPVAVAGLLRGRQLFGAAQPGQRLRHRGERPQYFRAMKATERKWGIPVHVQMATIHQESKFIGNARTPHRYALGVIPDGAAIIGLRL